MKNIVIFGATSAIAEHVARLFAAQGAKLVLVGRDGERLATISQDLGVRGATEVASIALDLNQVDRFAQMIARCVELLGSIDVALIAFGTLGDQAASERDAEIAELEMITNFLSPACLAGELAQQMERQGRGVLGVLSSIAGDRGRRSNYVYGSAKAGLSTFLAGLRHRFAGTAVKVVTIKPGLVDTPMTAGMKKGGRLWAQPQQVAKDIVGALESGRGVLYTPWFWRFIMLIIRFLPAPIFNKLNI